jgi:hypothetical protein
MRFTICLLLATLFAAPCRAATSQIGPGAFPGSATLITFETDPFGQPVALGTLADGIWAPLGVTFDSNDVVGDPVGGAFTIHSPPNVLSGDTTVSFQPINATFAPTVSEVGAWGFDFVLEVFNQQNQSLGAITYTDGSPGLFGGANEYGFLGFSSDVPIARAEFRRAFPNNGAYGFHIDDLVFAVPEPNTFVLSWLGAGLLFICFRARIIASRSAPGDNRCPTRAI